MTGQSVEGIWQALKVFENSDVDPGKLRITSMKGIKRSAARYGRVLGHRAGLGGAALLPYLDARRQIYLPAYHWVLENRVADLAEELRARARSGVVVLLDYNTNGEVDDLARPLSHAALAARYAQGDWPQ